MEPAFGSSRMSLSHSADSLDFYKINQRMVYSSPDRGVVDKGSRNSNTRAHVNHPMAVENQKQQDERVTAQADLSNTEATHKPA